MYYLLFTRLPYKEESSAWGTGRQLRVKCSGLWIHSFHVEAGTVACVCNPGWESGAEAGGALVANLVKQ